MRLRLESNSGNNARERKPEACLKITILTAERSKFEVEWLSILLHIREVLDSNPGPQISYSRRFSWFSTGSPGKCRVSISNYATVASLPVHSRFPNHSMQHELPFDGYI